jgi:DNA primase
MAALPAASEGAWRIGFEVLRRRDHQILLAVALNHPAVLDERAEVLGILQFLDPALDKLRQEILLLCSAAPDLESDALKSQLRDRGYSDTLGAVLAPDVYVHAGFARSGAEARVAREGFDQVVYRLHEPERQAQRVEAERAYAEDPTEENWTRLRTSMLSTQLQSRTEDSVTAAEIRSTANDLKMMSS